MNQTKKRLSIINLAISMTDIETIQLQILKLGLLKSDDKIQEIIETLYETNYAKAQSLIIEYIETPHHEILQRTFQKEKEKFHQQKQTQARFQTKVVANGMEPEGEPKTDKELINEFDLFNVSNENAPVRTIIDLDDMINMHNQKETEKQENNIDFDSLLNIKSDDIMPDNVSIDLSKSAGKEDFWELDENEKDVNPIEKDTFFDEEIPEIKIKDEPVFEEETETTENNIKEDAEAEPSDEPCDDLETEEVISTDTEETVEDDVQEEEEENNDTKQEEHTAPIVYEAITYIDQKFKNMQVQYPIKEESDENFTSVDQWLLQISNDGYNENDIEEMMTKIDTLRVEHKAEAAQLLLITAATQSKYAQFRLARALYTGDILEKNLPEAFTLINRLAVNEDYPEAICDLAQFYEYGIGIDKDKKKATLLYREAMDLGIQRAEAHVERLEKEKKGFFSFGKK